MEIVKITTSSESSVASLLNQRVCASQTPVSREGTTEIIFTLPSKSFKDFACKPLSNTVKLGAASPTFTSLPNNVIGLPANVITPVRFSIMNNLLRLIQILISDLLYVTENNFQCHRGV